MATLRTAINAPVGPVPTGGSASRSAVVRVVFASLMLALALWLATGQTASGPGESSDDSPLPVQLPNATILNAWAGVRVRTTTEHGRQDLGCAEDA